MCEFEISRIPDGTGLKLVGELDVATAPRLIEAVHDTSITARPVTLDLAELTFVDSSGIHAILTLAESLNGDGPLVILNPSDAVVRVFEILGLHEHGGIEVRRDMRTGLATNMSHFYNGGRP